MHFLDLIAMRVIQGGYGSWPEVMEMPTDSVMDAFHYLCFQSEYQETYTEINRTSK